MKSGTYCYRIELIAPLGPRHGEMNIQLTGNELSGVFAILGNTSAFTHGRYESGNIAIHGALKTLLYDLPYALTGKMDEDVVCCKLQTSKGVLSMSGTRMFRHPQTAERQNKQIVTKKAGKQHHDGIHQKN